jgi:hypothetical protein
MSHNLKGRQFGRLTVVEENGRINNRIAWLCRCECGNQVTLSSNRLLHKQGTKSCGCFRSEVAAKKATKHGMTKTRMYEIWSSMKKRCENKHSKSYDRYGGRGIKVCERWKDFENFYEDMKDNYQDNLTIDRIDNDGNYEPGNCRWITQQDQLNNYSRNVNITIDGETDTVKNMCIRYNVPYERTVRRIKRGIDPLTAMTAIYRNGTNEIIDYEQLKK